MPITTPPRVFLVCEHCDQTPEGDCVGNWVEARHAGDITAADLHERDLYDRPATEQCTKIFVFDTDLDHLLPPVRTVADAVACGQAFDQLDRENWYAWCALGRREGHPPTLAEFQRRYYGPWGSREEFVRGLRADRKLHNAAGAEPQMRDFAFIYAGDDGWYAFAN